jgi:hypothetical protein
MIGDEREEKRRSGVRATIASHGVAFYGAASTVQ